MAGFWWGAGGRRRGGPHRGGRIFEQGDLKYVILQLLEEKPRHGYDIIKELEDRFAGAYAPSPGTVYPTLSMLEDMGYARAVTEESPTGSSSTGSGGSGGGRKIYHITDEGRAYLGENQSTVDDIFERIAEIGGSVFSSGMLEVSQAFKRLGWATYAHAPRIARNTEILSRVKEILDRAAREVEDATREPQK
jgi:DNA-binding PadR family transcriptional regulator